MLMHPPLHHGPSLRFYLDADLYRRTDALLSHIESNDKASQHAKAFAELVNELTDSGLSYFFVEPLRQANAGYMAQKTAQIGMASVAKIAKPIVRKLISGLNDEQLKAVGAYVRRILH